MAGDLSLAGLRREYPAWLLTSDTRLGLYTGTHQAGTERHFVFAWNLGDLAAKLAKATR